MAHTNNHIFILQAEPCLLSLLVCKRTAEGVEPLSWTCERGDWAVESGALGEALKDFAAAHVPAGASVYTVVPRHEITTRIIALPTSDPAEIASMIRLSAEEYVPYSQQELVLDQTVLAKFRDGTVRVLAAFAHRDVVEGHVALLRQAGLEPERIFLSTACLASAVTASRMGTASRFAVANLGASGLEVAVFGDMGMEYGRAVSTRQDWSLESERAAEAIEEFAIEVRASLSAHRRESEDGLGAEAVYVTSDWADVAALCESAAHELGLEVIPAPFIVKAADGSSVPPALIGGALSAQGRGAAVISLVPKSLRDRRAQAAARRKAMKAGALAGAVVLAAAAVFGQAVWQRQSYLSELRGQAALIAPEAQSTLIKQRQLSILSRQVEGSRSALELMAKISGIAPSGCNISRFDYRRDRGIVIEGRALSGADAARFAEVIRDAADEDYAVLAGASMTNTAAVREQNATVYQYTIDIPFEDADADGEEAE